MTHELSIPADALARINMLFRKQQKEAETGSERSTKNSDARTDAAKDPDAEDESTNSPASNT